VMEETRREADALRLELQSAEERAADLEGSAHEAEARSVALEEAMREVGSLTISLENAKNRITEMEEEALEIDNKATLAEELARAMESRLHILESQMKAAEEKRKAAETRLVTEIEGRAMAEQRALTLENEFKTDLELDWARFEADIQKSEAAVKAREESIAKTSAEHARRETEELIQRLSAQIEEEQQARKNLEKTISETDTESGKTKGKLKGGAFRRFEESEDASKNRNEPRTKHDLEKQKPDVKNLNASKAKRHDEKASPQIPTPELVPEIVEAPQPSRATSANSSLLTLGLSDESYSYPEDKKGSRKYQIKLLVYGAAIAMLVVILIFLGLRAFHVL
jgi:hypothetical protein